MNGLALNTSESDAIQLAASRSKVDNTASLGVAVVTVISTAETLTRGTWLSQWDALAGCLLRICAKLTRLRL